LFCLPLSLRRWCFWRVVIAPSLSKSWHLTSRTWFTTSALTLTTQKNRKSYG
jgi:hypothetical protein